MLQKGPRGKVPWLWTTGGDSLYPSVSHYLIKVKYRKWSGVVVVIIISEGSGFCHDRIKCPG